MHGVFPIVKIIQNIVKIINTQGGSWESDMSKGYRTAPISQCKYELSHGLNNNKLPRRLNTNSSGNISMHKYIIYISGLSLATGITIRALFFSGSTFGTVSLSVLRFFSDSAMSSSAFSKSTNMMTPRASNG